MNLCQKPIEKIELRVSLVLFRLSSKSGSKLLRRGISQHGPDDHHFQDNDESLRSFVSWVRVVESKEFSSATSAPGYVDHLTCYNR